MIQVNLRSGPIDLCNVGGGGGGESFCLRRFKGLSLCTASLIFSTRLAVHKVVAILSQEI